jgi:hypothetical protein
MPTHVALSTPTSPRCSSQRRGLAQISSLKSPPPSRCRREPKPPPLCRCNKYSNGTVTSNPVKTPPPRKVEIPKFCTCKFSLPSPAIRAAPPEATTAHPPQHCALPPFAAFKDEWIEFMANLSDPTLDSSALPQHRDTNCKLCLVRGIYSNEDTRCCYGCAAMFTKKGTVSLDNMLRRKNKEIEQTRYSNLHAPQLFDEM